MPFEFLKLSENALNELPRTQTVIFYPVAPLEGFGPHLPVGNALNEAQAVAQLIAEKVEKEMPGWKALLYPPAPLGLETFTTSLAARVRGHVLRDYLVDTSRSLAKSGFRYFVCVSGSLTPKQLTAVEEASKMTSKRGFFGQNRIVFVSASSALVTAKTVLSSPLKALAPEHGGTRDTSVALAITPDHVGPMYLQLPQVSRSKNWLKRTISGYWGAPASASRDQGEKILVDTVHEIFPKLRAVLEGTPPGSLFRSWYSIIPSNKSFYKAWILFFALLALILIWILMFSRGQI